MDFWQVLKLRHSVRRFKDKEVSDDLIKKILEAAILAPSAGNIQDWRFIIIENEKIKIKIAEMALGQTFISRAPVVIIVCSDLAEIESAYGQRGRELYSAQNTAAATQNLLLAVTALGLGACWVGGFDEARVSEILDLDENWRPLAVVPIGYPSDRELEIHSRKKLSKVVKWIG